MTFDVPSCPFILIFAHEHGKDRGLSSLSDDFPLDTELHRELGAAIAAAAPQGVVHPDADADVEEETIREGASRGALDFNDTAASYMSFTNMELIR